MKRYQITLNGRSFDVLLLSDPRQEQVPVEVDGQVLMVEVRSLPSAAAARVEPAPTPTSAPAREPAGPSANTVTAPLPGLVKSIAVRVGQAVARGDELLVIEAMKMNNVIRAPHAGVIGTLHVAEGHQVAHGEPLVEYGV